MIRTLLFILCWLSALQAMPQHPSDNLRKAITLADAVFAHSLDTLNGEQRLSFYYDLQLQRPSTRIVSVWEYTTALEAVGSIMEALDGMRQLEPQLYETHFPRYAARFHSLFMGMDYYKGTFRLNSYTRHQAEWSPYGVNRAHAKGQAQVDGVLNVYDDQMWIVRELLRAYRLTGEQAYLERAEELTAYVLDGWDCTLDAQGQEHGGITWGPGYTSKHACSNGPMVSPLVWLSQIYKGKRSRTIQYTLLPDGTIRTQRVRKSSYYLDMAARIYRYHKQHYLMPDKGVCHDMEGGGGEVAYHSADGKTYRSHAPLGHPGGKPYTYNTGTLISGAADLYAATGQEAFLHDLQQIVPLSYSFFATQRGTLWQLPYKAGPTDASPSGSPWFNDVLLRGYMAASPHVQATHTYLMRAQQTLDYAYAHHLASPGFLPADLVGGWHAGEPPHADTMAQLSFASDYAMLALYRAQF